MLLGTSIFVVLFLATLLVSGKTFICRLTKLYLTETGPWLAVQANIDFPRSNVILISVGVESKLRTKLVRREGDVKNWKALWKVFKAGHFEPTRNSTILQKIIFANARERGNSKKDDGYVLFQGDIRLKRSEVEQLFNKTKGKRSRRAVLKYFKGNRWPKNGLVYDLHPSLSYKAEKVIMEAIKEWERVLPCLGSWINIKQLRNKPTAYIQFYSGQGCNSPVGRLGKPQRISIGKGCENKVIAVHEIGHAMGMWHEQSRPDRDRYIEILWDNIIPEWRSAFRKITASVVNSYGVQYDFESVMHYPSNAFAKHPGLETMKSKDGQRQLGNSEGLTLKDIKQVQRMYKCGADGKSKVACSDKSRSCLGWQEAGFCRPGNVYYNYMNKNCCKTCKDACSVEDEHRSCIKWSEAGFCHHVLYQKFMTRFCKKSCQC
ncbi:zinc metalloproteinase nas-6-like isoform X2 [Dendronephthya gigantea]|uniref:zinc metalloproteinase nas-6-like isoform X2 n=1 Tax=Dendronephthya gigantea TaxID=151771 RepID=UPI00106C91FD|nr:zinc metalloproteinase nas-6-like isoform X2 [Dendronephthya gigantea]